MWTMMEKYCRWFYGEIAQPDDDEYDVNDWGREVDVNDWNYEENENLENLDWTLPIVTTTVTKSRIPWL